MLTALFLILPFWLNITASATNWDTLLIEEALHIKLKKAVSNSGLKASKELQLFNQLVQ